MRTRAAVSPLSIPLALSFLFVCAFPSLSPAQAAPPPPASGAGEPPLIPMKDFFRNPEKAGFQLSPNGEYVAFLMPWQNRLNVHVQKTGEDKVTRVTSATERDILGCAWKGNGRLLYLQDKGGDENYHLFAVNIDGSEAKELTPFDKAKAEFVDKLEDNWHG